MINTKPQALIASLKLTAMLDSLMDPFDREIDFSVHYK